MTQSKSEGRYPKSEHLAVRHLPRTEGRKNAG